MDLIKENTFADICGNCEFVSSCFSNIDSCIKKTFDAVLETLTPREKETLKLLYGYNSVALSQSEAAQHFNITEERISQIHAKAVRKLRHPSRSKPLLKFAFDVLSSDARNFYALLLSDLFGETSYYIKLLYGVRLGVDFSLIYEQYCAKKTPAEIRDELSSNIFDFEELTECNEYLKAANISTLIQLLHTSRKTLLFKIFNGNDVAYFKLIKNLKNMGYRIKDEEQEDELYSFLINNIYQTIAPKAIYDQPLINFPLEITFLLLDKDISTVGELLSNFHLLHNSTGFTESIITTIEEFLMSQKLI